MRTDWQYLLIGMGIMAGMTYLIRVIPMAVFRKNEPLRSFFFKLRALRSTFRYDISSDFLLYRISGQRSGRLCGCSGAGLLEQRSADSRPWGGRCSASGPVGRSVGQLRF